MNVGVNIIGGNQKKIEKQTSNHKDWVSQIVIKKKKIKKGQSTLLNFLSID